MNKTDTGIHGCKETPELIERRNFWAAGLLLITTFVLSPLLAAARWPRPNIATNLPQSQFFLLTFGARPPIYARLIDSPSPIETRFATFPVTAVVENRGTRATPLAISRTTQHRKNPYSIA
jgi:hypothetical protein